VSKNPASAVDEKQINISSIISQLNVLENYSFLTLLVLATKTRQTPCLTPPVCTGVFNTHSEQYCQHSFFSVTIAKIYQVASHLFELNIRSVVLGFGFT
jgi:hypothetical protein